jgi:hypothetical protein
MAGSWLPPKRTAVRVTPRSVYNTNPNSRERGHHFTKRTRSRWRDVGRSLTKEAVSRFTSVLASQNKPEAGIATGVVLIKRTGARIAGALAFPKRNCGARDASARFTIRTQMTTAGRRPPQNKHFLRNHAKLPRAYSDLRLRRTLALSRRVSPNVLKMRQIKFDYFGTRGCRSRGSGEFPSKRPTTGTAQCCRACRVTPVLSNRAVAGRREL